MNVDAVLNEIQPGLPLQQRNSLREQLAGYLNELLQTNFGALVQLLYRVDVSEKKIKLVLQANPSQDAGLLLADLLIERQEQKIIARQNTPPPSGTEEERW